MNHLLQQHYMQLNTSHYWMLVNMCPDLLCWGLWEIQLQCCLSLLQAFASSGVSSLCSLSLCSCIVCNFACAILCHESCPTFELLYFSNVSSPAVQDADFSCCLKQPLTAWCHLLLDQFWLASYLSDWQWPWCLCLCVCGSLREQCSKHEFPLRYLFFKDG